MNTYLRNTAKQHASKDIGVTHVVVENVGDTKVLGFVTLTLKAVNREVLPNSNKLPSGHYTVAFIGQLAVDVQYQRQHIGRNLLYFTLSKALETSKNFDVIGVALDLLQEEGELAEVSEKRRRFYEARGFKSLQGDQQRLYISMLAVRGMGL